MRMSSGGWAEAALHALAEQGPEGVAVEPLAARLGTTKGSFYWHFSSRDELLTAALQQWEEKETEAIIAIVESEPDVRERLRWLMAGALADEPGAAVDIALAGHAADPRVGLILERVTLRRLDYLTRLFSEAGLPDPEAERRARLAYGAYLGAAGLRRSAPGIGSSHEEVAAQIEHTVATLLPDDTRPPGPLSASVPDAILSEVPKADRD
jgi:AcrR family transcriptional regulator